MLPALSVTFSVNRTYGSEEFVSEITTQHIAGKPHDRDMPAILKLSALPNISEITAATESMVDNKKLLKKTGVYLCHKYSGAKLKEIGERFGMGASAVSQARLRFMMEIVRDQERSGVKDTC